MMAAMPNLNGKQVLVIGGTGGIGRATAQLLAGAGAQVALTYHRDQAKGDAVAAELPGAGHAALPADIADSATLNELAATIERRAGRLDVLVNCAGVTRAVAHTDLDALDDATIDRMFAINWRGAFAAVRACRRLLAAHGDGLVVNISSIAGFTGIGSNIAYCAAKAGIDVMTKALARALAPDIRVLAVSAGVVDTDFVPGRDAGFNAQAAARIPLRRVASAEDIAEAVLACATLLRYSTGSLIVADGGRAL